MSQTITQDEDLLIISDEVHEQNDVLFLDDVLTPEINSSPVLQDTIPPNVDTVSSYPVEELILTDIEPETPSLDFSILSEIDSVSEPLVNINSEVVAPETSANIFDIKASPEPETVSGSVVSLPETSPIEAVVMTGTLFGTSSKQSSGDLNIIISETISKLEVRQGNIVTDKNIKSQQVQDLTNRVTVLEQEISLHEAEIDTLSAESDKITKSISQLEKMKLGDDEIITEHNAKRAVKK